MLEHVIENAPMAGQHPTRMITGAQMRAARALLGWSASELADRARVAYATVQRAEAAVGIPHTQGHNLFRIQQALEAGGIVFLDPGENREGGAGIRFRN
jgi:transcriptional regulator with XRE-family HTH domain